MDTKLSFLKNLQEIYHLIYYQKSVPPRPRGNEFFRLNMD